MTDTTWAFLAFGLAVLPAMLVLYISNRVERRRRHVESEGWEPSVGGQVLAVVVYIASVILFSGVLPSESDSAPRREARCLNTQTDPVTGAEHCTYDEWDYEADFGEPLP